MCRAAIGYGNMHGELSRAISSLSLPQVVLHSAHASAATHGTEAGLEVATLHDGGVQSALNDGITGSTVNTDTDTGCTANTLKRGLLQLFEGSV